MKKLLVLALALITLSCSTEETPATPVQDCNCDRVVSVQNFTIVGNPTAYLWKYTTINDCTQIQREKQQTVYDVNFKILLGECR